MNVSEEWGEWVERSLLTQEFAQGNASPWFSLLPVTARRVYCRLDARHAPDFSRFIRSPSRRLAARASWAVSKLGLIPRSARVFLSGSASTVLKDALPVGSNAEPALIQFGSPGPYQKVLTLCTNPGGESWVSKIAFQASADRLIEKEASWLLRLAEFPSLRMQLPELTLHGQLGSGRSFLTMPALTVGKHTAQFSGAHGQFLSNLCLVSAAEQDWYSSALRTRLESRIQCFAAPRFADLPSAVMQAWQLVEAEMASASLMTCFGHGDFAPWNISICGESIVVLDWEYAEEGATPLHDFFHFHCIQHALSTSGGFDTAWIVTLAKNALKFLRSILPSPIWQPADICRMLRLYLLDTISHYVEATDRFDPSDKVVAAYCAALGTLQTSSDEIYRRIISPQ